MARRVHGGYTDHYGDSSPKDCRELVLGDVVRHLSSRLSIFLLTEDDLEDLLAKLDTYYWVNWRKIIRKRNPKAHVLWIGRKRLLNEFRPKRVLVWVEFRRGTKIRRVISNLSLIHADYKHVKRNDPQKPTIEIHLHGYQVDPLARHPSVEGFVIIHDGRGTMDIDAVTARYLERSASLSHFWADFDIILHNLAKNHRKEVRAFRIREIEGCKWKEVSEAIGCTREWCRELNRRCKRRIAQEYPEFREYLRDLDNRI